MRTRKTCFRRREILCRIGPEMDFSLLRPFQSFMLAKLRDGAKSQPVIDEVLADFQEMGEFKVGGVREILNLEAGRQEGELYVGGLHYLERRRATWTADPSVQDVLNEVAVIFRRKRYNFSGTDGLSPYGIVQAADGVFYGTTAGRRSVRPGHLV
jgi:hypothetical protein